METQSITTSAGRTGVQIAPLTVIKRPDTAGEPGRIVRLHSPEPVSPQTLRRLLAVMPGASAARGEFSYLGPTYLCRPFKEVCYESQELTRYDEGQPLPQAEEQYAPLNKNSLKNASFWARL